MTTADLVAALAVATSLLLFAAPRRRPSERLHVVTGAILAADRAASRGQHRVALVAVAAAGAALVIAPVPSLLVAAAVVVLGGLASLVRRRYRSRRAATARSTAVIEVTFALAAELRAGRTPAAALAAVATCAGPLGEPLREVAAVTGAGVPVADELRRIAELPGAGELASVASVWAVTEQHGGPVADVLERLGGALDAEAAGRRALEAALAGPRATMGLLLVLPGLGVAMGESVGAEPVRFLLHDPVGWALLAAAAVLDLAGVAWTRRLLIGAARS